MDLQYRLKRLSDERGSVAVEAAFSIAAMVVVFSLLVQGGTAALVYLRMLSVGSEAAVMAASSGRASVRETQAREWIATALPNATASFDYSEREVTVELAAEVALLGGALTPLVRVSASAVRIDAAAWS